MTKPQNPMLKSNIKTLKIFVLTAIFVISTFLPAQIHYSLDVTIIVGVVLFLSGLLYISTIGFNTLKSSFQIEKPSFENRLSDDKPLTIYQFLFYGLMAVGLGQILGGYIQYSNFSALGIWLLSIGAGIRLSWFIELRRVREIQ